MSKSAQIRPISTLMPKIWRITSYCLMGIGLILMSWGGWLFYQQQLEAGKPPPAPIVDSLAKLPTVTPTAQVPMRAKETLGETIVIEAAVEEPEPNVPQTVEPEPVAVLPETELEPPSEPTAVEAPAELPSFEPVDLEDDTLSLADNPLWVSEETISGETESPQVVNVAPANGVPGAITRLVAESIGLDTPVVDVGWQTVEQNGKIYNLWTVADYAAGWHQNSSLPGQGGNVVLSGHHNIKGEVFRYLVDLEIGDPLSLTVNDQVIDYVIDDKFIVKDKGEPEEVRIANARWIGPFEDERLTLVTCWPYNNNTHRLIVIARPVGEGVGQG